MNTLLDNYEGKQFGEWTVLYKTRPNVYGNTYWRVKCSCGKERELTGRTLRYGNSTHCGCKRTKKLTKYPLTKTTAKRKSRIKDESGKIFGRLTVIKPTRKNAKGEWYFLCKCVCGNETEVRGSHLRKGTIKSCGCLSYEISASCPITHGCTYTRAYTTFRNRNRERKEEFLDTWSPEMEQFLREVFPACVLCGKTDEEHLKEFGTVLHTDHVRPLSKGFGLSSDNAVRLCATCNREKWAKDLDDLPEPIRDRLIQSAELFKLLWDGRKYATN